MRDNLLLRLLDLEDDHAALDAKHQKAIRALDNLGGQLAIAAAACVAAKHEAAIAHAQAADMQRELHAKLATAEADCVAAQLEAAIARDWAAGMQRELHAKLAAADAARVAALRDAASVRDWAAGSRSELQDLRRQLAEARAGRAAAEEAEANAKAYLAFMRATGLGATTY